MQICERYYFNVFMSGDLTRLCLYIKALRVHDEMESKMSNKIVNMERINTLSNQNLNGGSLECNLESLSRTNK